MEWVEGEVVDLQVWTPGLFSLYVKAPIAPFIAGQFTQLCLNPDHPKLFRPYSFVNAPDEPILEFYFTLVNQGAFSHQLAKLTPKAQIWLAHKASGRFCLNIIKDAPILWLMATGTGLGVFLSMLKTLEVWQRFKKIVLLHSVRFKSELTHQDLITRWQTLYGQQFHYCPIVTREQFDPAYAERITKLIESRCLEEDLNLSLANESQIMLCGNPQMIKEVSLLLQARGLALNLPHKSGSITFENYWKLHL